MGKRFRPAGATAMLGVAALGLAAAALGLLAAPGSAAAQDWREGRKGDAVMMCRERARSILQDRGDRDIDIAVDDISRASEDNDRVKVQGYYNVRTDDRRRTGRAWVDCEVDFEGRNQVTYFDEDAFLDSLRNGGDRYGDRRRGDDRDRDYGRDRDGDRRGGNAGDAQRACRELARDQGFDVRDFDDRDRLRGGDLVRLQMSLRRGDNRFDATCDYNPRNDDARFVELNPARGNR